MKDKDIEVEIEELCLSDDNIKDFEEFLEEFGIEEPLKNTTSQYLKNKLEELIKISEEGNDSKLKGKGKEFKKLLKNLESVKDKRAEITALQDVYSELQNYDLDLGDLDKKLKQSLKDVKKYEHFKKHEEKLVKKWLRELDRKERKEEKREEKLEKKEEKAEKKAEKKAAKANK